MKLCLSDDVMSVVSCFCSLCILWMHLGSSACLLQSHRQESEQGTLPSPQNPVDAQQGSGQLQELDQSLCGQAGAPCGATRERGGSDSLSLPLLLRTFCFVLLRALCLGSSSASGS